MVTIPSFTFFGFISETVIIITVDYGDILKLSLSSYENNSLTLRLGQIRSTVIHSTYIHDCFEYTYRIIEISEYKD